jgi:hypothetical protein
MILQGLLPNPDIARSSRSTQQYAAAAAAGLLVVYGSDEQHK